MYDILIFINTSIVWLLQSSMYCVISTIGVAVGPEFCNPESSSLLDPTIWTVSVGMQLQLKICIVIYH